MTVAQTTIDAFTRDLAQRSPTPGGGAAAAVAAAFGCAAAAMAARYATGSKWAAVEAHSLTLAAALEQARQACLVLADADATAYLAVGATRSNPDPQVHAQALEQACRVPEDLLACCAHQCAAISTYLPHGNPQLRSDLAVAIHLLAGAGRSAWQTLLVNKPDGQRRQRALGFLQQLDACESALLAASG